MDTDKIVVPPPLTKKYTALEFTDPTIPGEIKIDQSGKLLKEWFQMEGPIGSLVDQYNNFITNVLPQIIASRTLTIPAGEVSFENVFLSRPTIKTVSGRPKELYPNMCRESDYSYNGEIYFELVLNRGQPSEEKIKDKFGENKKTFIGKIPVMLGSDLDWLKGKTDHEKEELGEGIGINEGYFIIKGREKIVLIQEKLRPNRFFVYNNSSKGDVVVKITNNTLLGSTQITMARGKKSKALKMHLGFMKRNKGASNKLGNTISVFQVYRMLGVSDPKEIFRYISMFTRPENLKKIYVVLQPTFVKLSKIGDDVEYLSKKMGLGSIDYEIRKSDIMKDLINQLFPQIPADQITQKLYMLSIMTARLVEALIGARELDDRDSWGNKQLVSAGKSLELLFASIWREAILKAQTEIDTKKLNGLNAVERVLDPAFITDNFVESFTQNNWGVQSSYMTKENITDILNRQSVLAVYSHLTKVNTPSSSKGKAPKARMVQMSQLGYIDPGETPEGHQCLEVSTPVLMKDGSWKPIGDIVEGDEVITVNPDNLVPSPSKITQPFRFHSALRKKMFRLWTEDREFIDGTEDHPFLTNRGWVKMENLTYYTKVCVLKNNIFEFVEIGAIEEIPPAEVADFTTISSNHSFIAKGFVTHNCGLVKNTAMTNYISLDRPESVIIERISKYVSNVPAITHPNPFILNGVFQGWVNGPELKDFAIRCRRQLIFEKDTAIVLERDGFFNIYTDACRPTRPLMIVDPDGQLVIEKKNLWKADFLTLLREGCVEYIDAWEQDSLLLAQRMDDLKFRKREIEMAMAEVRRAEDLLSGSNADAEAMLSQAQAVLKELLELPKYTHSEMDPTAIMGMAISVIPLSETIPGPRSTYQAGMGKQSMGIYHSSHYNRFDTSSKLLAYPSRPMFETQMNEVLGLNELPAGETVILAITTYTGFAQEDAIVMAQGAVDRGLFRNVVYKTYKSVAKKKNEKFGRPEIDKGKEARYDAISDNGLPRLGSVIKEGDCVIGKMRKNPETGKWDNTSTYMELRQEGIIDRVLVSTNQEGERVVKVKIRQVRKPMVGDKFACYTPDHQVLTNRGWVYFPDLKHSDLVFSLEGNTPTFYNPTVTQNYDYDGPMYEVSDGLVDLCVTPNHRMYVKLDKEYEILKAEEIYGKSVSYKNLHGEYQSVGKDQWTEYSGKVYCCTVPSGIIYVKRKGIPVWCGNSRYAQKGTVGLILPDEDMPFTASGVRPDILINPHALPSRMTIGKLIEIVASKVSAFTGERVNATSFRNFDHQEFMRNLVQYGYSSSGKERMYSGVTGKPLEAMIFTGPCYYQALKHQVVDKIQMRGRGGITQLTHQPVSGLKRGGGQRVGEMERDAIISHGASAFLRERLCLVSDPYEAIYCSTCGTIAITSEDKVVCRNCDDEAKFGTCTIPYSFKLLMQLLAGAGLSMKFKMK